MSLISIDGLHQLHILIFFLAVFHVVFSVTTMTLGRVKVRDVFFFVCMILMFFLSLS